MWRAILIKSPRNQIIRCHSTILPRFTEYTDVPEYPPILDLSQEAKKARELEAFAERMKKVPTIEEKLIELNMPRYYGFKNIALNDNNYPYNALPYIRYLTKTDFQELTQDPEEEKKVDKFFDLVKSELYDAIEFEMSGYLREYQVNRKLNSLDKRKKMRMKASSIVSHLNRVLTRILGADNAHLYESDVDIDPRIEAFWFVGGITPPLNVRKLRYAKKHLRDKVYEPVKRSVQYVGTPLLALRHQYPLQPFDNVTDFNSLNSPNPNIEAVNFVKEIDPTAAHFKHVHRHGVTVPGFWPGNVREYGLLSFYDRTVLAKRPLSYGEEDIKEALHALAITSSFSYTFGQATYQGFTPYNDMTYPLSTQTIITDGKIWSFYRYQLNTTIMHTEPSEKNYKFNQCWGTPEMQLFEHIDENGKIHGLNDDVFKQLIRFYLSEPLQRDYEMKPYLDPHEKKIADIEDPKRREWLERTFKYVVSNRNRYKEAPEIYNWEKIYKIDFQSRPMDKKRRFFEFGINPFNRQLKEHPPGYIPRCLRPGGIYDKKKYPNTYYPLDHRSNDPRTMSHSMFGAPRKGPGAIFDRRRVTYY